jgi:hypothetical protein
MLAGKNLSGFAAPCSSRTAAHKPRFVRTAPREPQGTVGVKEFCEVARLLFPSFVLNDLGAARRYLAPSSTVPLKKSRLFAVQKATALSNKNERRDPRSITPCSRSSYVSSAILDISDTSQ